MPRQQEYLILIILVILNHKERAMSKSLNPADIHGFPLKTTKRSTQIIFLMCGIALSAWAPMVPFVKDHLLLNDSELGILLLFLGGGGICVMPFTERLINRFGTRNIIVSAVIIIAGSFPLILQVQTFWLAALTLFIFGAGIGMLDVSMNTHGTFVQKQSPAHIMSSLHGLYSAGGIVGPLFVGLLIKNGLTPFNAALVVCGGILLSTATQYSKLISASTERSLTSRPAGTDENERRISPWTHGPVLFIGAMCFIVFSSEGSVLDWGALLLRDIKKVDESYAGIGFASFSVAMAVMRLSGDRIVTKFNSTSVVLYGSIIAFAGFVIAILAPWVILSLFGFVLIGIGAANIVPVYFTAAGNIPNVSNASAIAVIATVGYAGMLIGPAMLGFIAEHVSLPMALFVAGFALLISGFAYWFYSRRSKER